MITSQFYNMKLVDKKEITSPNYSPFLYKCFCSGSGKGFKIGRNPKMTPTFPPVDSRLPSTFVTGESRLPGVCVSLGGNQFQIGISPRKFETNQHLSRVPFMESECVV